MDSSTGSRCVADVTVVVRSRVGGAEAAAPVVEELSSPMGEPRSGRVIGVRTGVVHVSR